MAVSITALNLKNFSYREKESMLLKLIQKYPEGLIKKEIQLKTGMNMYSIKKAIRNLISKKKISIAYEGKVYYYPLKQNGTK